MAVAAAAAIAAAVVAVATAVVVVAAVAAVVADRFLIVPQRGWELAPEVRVHARASTPEADALAAVFGAFETPPSPAAFAISTEPVGDRLRVSWRGLALFTCAPAELAPALEASLMGWVARTRAGTLPLHAGAVRWGDRALLLIGDKGSGKSTLAAQLGAVTDYLGDEIAFVGHDLVVDPFPKAATIKEGAFGVLPPARIWRDPVRGAVAYHTPRCVSRVARPIGPLVWPSFSPGLGKASLEVIAPAEAALRLVRGAFGGLGRTPRTIEVVARLAVLPAFTLEFPGVDAARTALEQAFGPP